MSAERFIALRLLRDSSATLSRPIVRVAFIGVALSTLVMWVALSVTLGFQHEVAEKIEGFGGQVQLRKYQHYGSFESDPIDKTPSYLPALLALPGVEHVQAFAMKTGLLKTEEYNQGIVLKGVDEDFDASFFQRYLLQGGIPDFGGEKASTDILISARLARLLHLQVDDKVRAYFVSHEEARGRVFFIRGIYESGLSTFDEKYILADLRQVQSLNHWDEQQIEGFELRLSPSADVHEQTTIINTLLPMEQVASSIANRFPELYGWLSLMDMNVLIILVIMSVVAAIGMLSAFVVLMMEKTHYIGLLKTLGMPLVGIRRLFLYQVSAIAGVGMLLGNLLGFALCYVQQKFHLIALNSETYFLSHVPIRMELQALVAVNIGCFSLCILFLLLASRNIRNIREGKALKFD